MSNASNVIGEPQGVNLPDILTKISGLSDDFVDKSKLLGDLVHRTLGECQVINDLVKQLQEIHKTGGYNAKSLDKLCELTNELQYLGLSEKKPAIINICKKRYKQNLHSIQD